MIIIPIYEYECHECGKVFESIEIWESHKVTKCKFCDSQDIIRIISIGQVRMDPDVIKHNLPDPCPPLEELRGKNRPDCEGGYKDKPYQDTNLANYTRRKDKRGNTVWIEKRRKYFHSK